MNFRKVEQATTALAVVVVYSRRTGSASSLFLLRNASDRRRKGIAHEIPSPSVFGWRKTRSGRIKTDGGRGGSRNQGFGLTPSPRLQNCRRRRSGGRCGRAGPLFSRDQSRSPSFEGSSPLFKFSFAGAPCVRQEQSPFILVCSRLFLFLVVFELFGPYLRMLSRFELKLKFI